MLLLEKFVFIKLFLQAVLTMAIKIKDSMILFYKMEPFGEYKEQLSQDMEEVKHLEILVKMIFGQRQIGVENK